ncbi:MAG TPA: class I SAM-dependent methyltransferase [Candidatus Angelobacter sp.]|nr:class I SAM-dependent methyltransferase [Candidatus Angelobacter sp.]
MSLEWLYGFDELNAYRLDTKKGKERLEARVKNLPELLSAAGISLLKEPRVLCLMAGSCIEGIAFAQIYDADVTCIDLQERLLRIGLREARRRKLKLRVVRGDVREPSKLVSGKFDLVTVLGQPLPHIGIFDFDQTISGVKKLLAKNGTFLIDQSDLIFRILPQYRDAMTHNLDPPVFSVHNSLNARQGYFERLFYSRTRHDVYKTYLWAPWIIEYMLKKNGFREVEVKPYVDLYSTPQTYLHIARGPTS